MFLLMHCSVFLIILHQQSRFGCVLYLQNRCCLCNELFTQHSVCVGEWASMCVCARTLGMFEICLQFQFVLTFAIWCEWKLLQTNMNSADSPVFVCPNHLSLPFRVSMFQTFQICIMPCAYNIPLICTAANLTKKIPFRLDGFVVIYSNINW